MRILRRACVVILTILGLLGVWGFWWEPHRFRVREETLKLPDWPRELSGLRVALLADLHVGSPYNGRKKLREIVRRTNEAHPDLVCMLGDYVKGRIQGHWVSPRDFAKELGKLQAPLGVFAVLGNHDHWFGAETVSAALRDAGITVLEDQAQRVTFQGSELWIGGISDYREGKHDIRGTLHQVTDDAPVILMTHNPDLFPLVPARVNLLLAGHTHGGQVVFPFVGALIVPSIYGNQYLSGHIVERGHDLFVSSGTGMSYLPVRFLVPPEIPILELKAPTP
ncbi:MAG TPA: metallophosphoesterase [Candidatus Polarisedimenticolia bacterium]|nr:metallophosphoesterase [Candidatus Polarisedimenticolia bacterium]